MDIEMFAIIFIGCFIILSFITFWLVPYLLQSDSRINNTIREVYEPWEVYPLHFIAGLITLYLILFYEYKDEWRLDYERKLN